MLHHQYRLDPANAGKALPPAATGGKREVLMQAHSTSFSATLERWNQAEAELGPDAAFEQRCEQRRALAIRAMRGRVWRCPVCGYRYGPAWIYHNGLQCDVDCGGVLEEMA